MKKFKYSEITPEKIYKNRRSFVKSIGYGLGTLSLGIMPFSNNANAANNEEGILTQWLTTGNDYSDVDENGNEIFEHNVHDIRFKDGKIVELKIK